METIQFADKSKDPDGEIVSWEWDFGDSTISAERNPRHRYTRKGTFTITLTVTDDDGLTSKKEAKIEVVNIPPEARFGFSPEEPEVGEKVEFDATGCRDPDGKVVGYHWDFGDGTKADRIRVFHTYAEEGSYRVSLTVVDDDGVETRVEKVVEVKRRPEPVRPREVWGVIIGISDYDEDSLDLRCAQADAEAMRDVLLENGVSKDHLRVLLDDEATLVEVREALGWLMENVGEDDLVIFYFSGHGYQGRDFKPKDESDGLDEYFVVHDTKESSMEATALRDDEFGQFLDELPSRYVLVIFDSCYSGGLPKGQRGIPRGGTPRGPLDFFNDFDLKGKLVLAASAEDQFSWEDKDLGHGVFTYFLVEGLEGKADMDGDHRVTVEEVYEYVREKVPGYVKRRFGEEQEPQLIGFGEREVVVARRNMPPEADFSYSPEAPIPGKGVEFEDKSRDDGEIVAWEWEFGDGGRSEERNPVHVYREPGVYVVRLRVTDDGDLSARVEKEIEVHPPGEVTAVDRDRGLVTISLGTRHGVKVVDRFQVYLEIPVPGGPPLEEVHGVIEVVHVVGPERSICRIVEEFFAIRLEDKVRLLEAQGE